jgi:hypothetical protein
VVKSLGCFGGEMGNIGGSKQLKRAGYRLRVRPVTPTHGKSRDFLGDVQPTVRRQTGEQRIGEIDGLGAAARRSVFHMDEARCLCRRAWKMRWL